MSIKSETEKKYAHTFTNTYFRNSVMVIGAKQVLSVLHICI